MREYLERLQSHSLISKVNAPLSPDLEISSIMLKLEKKPLLFENVEGSSLSVAGNIYAGRNLLALGLEIETIQIISTLRAAIDNPANSKGKESGYKDSDWDYSGPADLGRLPILKHFENEAGKYITAGVVIAKFPKSDLENLSFHRMLVLEKDKVALRIVPRHLNQIIKESPNQRIRISVVIGPPPSVFTAASFQTQFGCSEYTIANKLSNGKLELKSSELSDLAYPLDSEILLEGWLDAREEAPEGPFVDLTGTYDDVRKQPVIKFDRMHYRTNSVYQAVVASSAEHSLFMGLPQELKISEALSKSIPRIRGINLTPASNGYFHCVVSIDKGNDGDGKTAILNCFAASHPLKLVIAVDYDIDPFDLGQVEWALATRFQADRGSVVVNGAKGSSLDPSSGKTAVTSKLGLDATLPIKTDKSKYQRASTKLSRNALSTIESLGFPAPIENTSHSSTRIEAPSEM
ncbi:MAG: UbiD family decarboxylase [Nitrososphaerales archaeon]